MVVVCKVVEYLEGRRRNSFNPDIDEHNKTKSILTPLLFVSERWRIAALDSICDNCKFDFDASRESVEVSYPAWPADFSYPRFRKNNLVKQVVVAAAFWADLYTGKFCQVIARPQYESLIFSSATTLILNLSDSIIESSKPIRSGYSYDELSDADIQSTAVSIVDSLLHLTPALVGITVSVLPDQEPQRDYRGQFNFREHHNQETGFGGLYGKIMSELCRGSAKCLQVFSQRNNPPLSFGLNAISGLTSITQGVAISCEPFSKLAYLNAPTLKELDMRLATEIEWSMLIYGGTTAPACFTSLASLTLDIPSVAYSVNWAVIEDIAPFPVLSTLAISGGYPFDDDLLFRENGGTMKCLSIPFSALARNVLGRFGVLKRSGVTQMTRVCIGEVTGLDNEFMARRTVIPIKQQMHRILEVALALKLWNDTSDLRMFYAVHNAPSTATLRCLEFGNISVDTGYIIRIVSAIPSLVSLTCVVGGLGIAIESIVASKRPSRLHTKYYPLGANFRKLAIPYTASTSAEQAAYAAMYIAILCPSFTHLDISPKLRNPFSREIAWAAFNCPFEAYADTLRRLIYRM
ncbi:hypothetical protein H4S07_002068 [Coemansia furcata]|uniref:Uncharacterized protein n=1 Tax=Coemansia furcata TaxID=417177 RepID=A0ACC1LL31_9FUNG|nr:hypothetical protein H4S07_002068 [Coemansia furcata]